MLKSNQSQPMNSLKYRFTASAAMRMLRLCMRPVAAPRAVAFFIRRYGDSHRKREIKSCRNYIYGAVL